MEQQTKKKEELPEGANAMVAQALRNVKEMEKKEAEKEQIEKLRKAVKEQEQKLKKEAPKTKIESEKKKEELKNASGEKLAAVLIRGVVGVPKTVRDTLFMLKLRRKHACVVLDKNPNNLGMLKKCKDYLAFGEIENETLKELETKRGQKDKPFFRLHPPRGGFKGKGIKKSFKEGGVLGYHQKKINELIRRMI